MRRRGKRGFWVSLASNRDPRSSMPSCPALAHRLVLPLLDSFSRSVPLDCLVSAFPVHAACLLSKPAGNL